MTDTRSSQSQAVAETVLNPLHCDIQEVKLEINNRVFWTVSLDFFFFFILSPVKEIKAIKCERNPN